MEEKKTAWFILFFAWIISMSATMGSLFFSDVMGFPPCTMCWYQRICMYPLVAIFLVALIRKNGVFEAPFYSAPLVVVGWFWAFYHCLLIYGFITEEMTPCSLGVPCSVSYVNWLGFIDIPTLSLVSFTLIGISLLILNKKKDTK